MLWKSGRGIEPDVSIPCCSFLPPHFKKKPSKAVTLPLVKKRGTSCSQHDSVTGMEEMREKEFQQKQLAWELADLLLAQDTLYLYHFSWTVSNSHTKKRCYTRER